MSSYTVFRLAFLTIIVVPNFAYASNVTLPSIVSGPSECCGSMFGDVCADGTAGTPCCGVGRCNAFCCSCEGGCRMAPPVPAPTPSPLPPSAASTPLIQWPMIMTHDAGTSYYASETCSITHSLANYVMTQVPGSFSSQLACGARAFDIRLYQKWGKLVMHHGDHVIPHTISDVLGEILQWAASNPTELVVLYGSHCNDDDCSKMFYAALELAKIPRVECAEIINLTLGSAMSRGRLPKGGSVLGIFGCVEEHFVPAIRCYGSFAENDTSRTGNTLQSHALQRRAIGVANVSAPPMGGRDPHTVWTCYDSQADKAFGPFWEYMANMSDGRGKRQSKLWMTQAHWQTDASSIAQGELKASCVLLDESRAGVNSKVAHRIRQGFFSHINLLEVDNVCGGYGLELFKALRGRFMYDIVAVDTTAVVV